MAAAVGTMAKACASTFPAIVEAGERAMVAHTVKTLWNEKRTKDVPSWRSRWKTGAWRRGDVGRRREI